jgi:hypothetical protein
MDLIVIGVNIVQIAVLAGCIYMTWHVRRILSGMAPGLIGLLVLLIVRRLDDAFDVLDTTATLVLSSLVVILVTYDLYKLFRMRHVYSVYFQNRQRRIDDLERMWQHGGRTTE